MPTEQCVNYLLELMNLPPLDVYDSEWFFSDWEADEARPLAQRFHDLFISHWR